MDTIRVHLLGEPAIDSEGSPPTPVPLSLQPLLGYLAIEPPPARQRDRVLTALWPDVDPVKGRRRLNTAIWRLRRLLGDDGGRIVQCGRGGHLSLEPNAVEIDAAGLLDLAIAATEPTRTLGDDPRPVIPPFDDQAFLSGCYHEWAVAIRVRLGNAVARSLEAELRRHRADRDLERAVGCAQQLLDRDPHREDVHRTLIHLFIELGRYDDAERQFDRCTHLLRTALDVEPLTETVLAVTEARHRRLAECGSSDPGLPVLGNLHAALQHCRSALDEIELATRQLQPTLRTDPPTAEHQW